MKYTLFVEKKKRKEKSTNKQNKYKQTNKQTTGRESKEKTGLLKILPTIGNSSYLVFITLHFFQSVLKPSLPFFSGSAPLYRKETKNIYI